MSMRAGFVHVYGNIENLHMFAMFSIPCQQAIHIVFNAIHEVFSVDIRFHIPDLQYNFLWASQFAFEKVICSLASVCMSFTSVSLISRFYRRTITFFVEVPLSLFKILSSCLLLPTPKIIVYIFFRNVRSNLPHFLR